MEAQISGTQRKIFGAAVRPLRVSDGEEGIVLRNGVTAPFVVVRSWSAPAGVYPEAWYLVDPGSREVLHGVELGAVHIHGLQSLTELRSEVRDPVRLPLGRLQIVFALGGVRGGELDVEVREAAPGP